MAGLFAGLVACQPPHSLCGRRCDATGLHGCGPALVCVGGTCADPSGGSCPPLDAGNGLEPDAGDDAGIRYVNHWWSATADAGVGLALPASAAGDALLVVVTWNSPDAGLLALTDSQGNAFVRAAGPTRGAPTNHMVQALYYALAIDGGADTVSVTLDSRHFLELRVLEYAGLASTGALDAVAEDAGSGGIWAGAGPVTTQSPNELILAAGSTEGAFGDAGPGFEQAFITSCCGDLDEEHVASAAGTYLALGYQPQGAWVMQVATFRGR